MTNKMYLQSDNGGNGILIQDIETNRWYYWSEYHLPIDLASETDEENAEIIRAAIESGNMYDADDFITETDDAEEHEIEEYAGMNIEEIDRKENYVKDIYSGDVHPAGHDLTSWAAI